MSSETSRKTWKSVALAIAAISLVLAVAIIGGAIGFYVRHVRTEVAAPQIAAGEFERARGPFGGQQPFIKYRGFEEEPVVRRDPSAPRRDFAAMHILAYDGASHQLRRVDIPAAILRLMTVGGRIRLVNLQMFGDQRDRITLDDLERHGPGLVLDERVGVSRLLVWTE